MEFTAASESVFAPSVPAPLCFFVEYCGTVDGTREHIEHNIRTEFKECCVIEKVIMDEDALNTTPCVVQLVLSEWLLAPTHPYLTQVVCYCYAENPSQPVDRLTMFMPRNTLDQEHEYADYISDMEQEDRELKEYYDELEHCATIYSPYGNITPAVARRMVKSRLYTEYERQQLEEQLDSHDQGMIY
jgi:hypothetical protein